jgi:hypothetical protein
VPESPQEDRSVCRTCGHEEAHHIPDHPLPKVGVCGAYSSPLIGRTGAQRLRDDPVGFIRRNAETGLILIRQEDGWLAIHRDETVPQLAYHYADIGGWDILTDRFLPLRVHRVQ